MGIGGGRGTVFSLRMDLDQHPLASHDLDHLSDIGSGLL